MLANNQGMLLLLILLLVFGTTGADGISGDESVILILLALGFVLIGGGLIGGGCACHRTAVQ